MDPITMMAASAAQGVGQQAAGMGMNMLDEWLFGNKRRKQQIKQQQKLTDQQVAANKELADYGMGISKQMFEATGYGAQRRQMEEAGLNPALMYGHAGSGGSTQAVGAGQAGGAQASDEMSQKRAAIEQQGMGLQMQRQQAEIRLLNAQAEEHEKGAELKGEQTTTESSKRETLLENMKQEGIGQWLNNVEKRYSHTVIKDDVMELYGNKVYGINTALQGMSAHAKEITSAILKTEAETGNQEAQELLTNEKAKYVFQELLVAMQNANANEVRAKASELSVMWDTGEFTNWRTWVEVGAKALNSISGVVNIGKALKGTK